MKTIEELKEDVQDLAHHAQLDLEHKGTRAMIKQQAATAALLAKQQKDLQRLQGEVKVLRQQRSSGGGFPWGLLLVAGGAYALYRTNPTVREQVQGLLKRVNPGVEGNLTRAGDAAKDAVSNVAHGQNPGAAVHAAGGELQRAGEKAVEGARNDLQNGKPNQNH